jgi:cytochrome c oxidase subunit IV
MHKTYIGPPLFYVVLSARNASVQYHMVQGFAQWVDIATSFVYSTLNVFPVNVHMVKTLLLIY